jgi:hypothetical protein
VLLSRVERDKHWERLSNPSQLDQSPQQLQYPYDTHNAQPFILFACENSSTCTANTISNKLYPGSYPRVNIKKNEEPALPMLSSHIMKESPVTHFTWTLVIMMKNKSIFSELNELDFVAFIYSSIYSNFKM